MATTQQNIRDECINAQVRARAIELRLEQVRRELDNLQSLSLGSLLSALQGRRGEKISAAQELCRQMEQQHAEALAALRHLEQQVAALGDTDRSATTASPPAATPTGSDDLVQRIERAMRAGQEALRDLRDEIETMSKRGRSILPARQGLLLSLIVQPARGAVASDCAGRVVQSLQRFAAAIEPVFSGTDQDAELLVAQREIQQAAAEFDGSTFSCAARCDALLLCLQTADMLLERKLLDTNKRPT